MENIFLPILPKHVWEHVSPQAAGTTYVEPAADRRQRPLLHRGLQEGRLRRDEAQPLLLGQEADRRQDLLRDVPERRHDGAGPEVGRRSTAPGASPRPSSRSSSRMQRHPHHRLQLLQLGLPRPELLDAAELDRQPGAARRALSRRPELRDRPRHAGQGRLRRPRGAGDHDHAARHLVQPRLPLAAAGRHEPTRSTSPRPTSSSTRPATPAARTACGSTRASRSPCAWRPRPTSRRARSRPS